MLARLALRQSEVTGQSWRGMARVVKGKGAAVRDGVLRRAAVDSKPKDSVAAEDLEVGRITSAHGQHFEVEMSNGQTYKVRHVFTMLSVRPRTPQRTLHSAPHPEQHKLWLSPRILESRHPPQLIRHRPPRSFLVASHRTVRSSPHPHLSSLAYFLTRHR